jgi:hypothetical protein
VTPRDELRRLVLDTKYLLLAWRYAPRRHIGVWLLALLRVFSVHPENNRFRKLVFFILTGVTATLLIGQSGFGWSLDQAILLPVVATWLFVTGIYLGVEVQRIKVPGFELDIADGELRQEDGDD